MGVGGCGGGWGVGGGGGWWLVSHLTASAALATVYGERDTFCFTCLSFQSQTGFRV